MKNKKAFLSLSFFILLIIPCFSSPLEKDTSAKLHPLELSDVLKWKNIRNAVISNNGEWFVYRLSPNEGNSEVVIRKTDEVREYRFSLGAFPRFGFLGKIAISEDSKWVAFLSYPDHKETIKQKKNKEKICTDVSLVNLATGEKKEFANVKRFLFSGEKSGWIAFHKYPPEAQEKGEEKWRGSDLILLELATSKTFNIGNVSDFAFDQKGNWLAYAIDSRGKSGNGVQLRNMNTGVVFSLDTDKASYQGLTWAEKGDGLVFLKGIENKNYEDKLYSVIAFKNFSSKPPQKITYDPIEDKNFPEGMTISPNREPMWTVDMNGVFFGIHEAKRKEEKEKSQKQKKYLKEKKSESIKEKEKAQTNEEFPDLVIWHWLDKRLQSQQWYDEGRDKNFSYLCIYNVEEKKFIRLADKKLREVAPVTKHRWAIGFDKREYDLMCHLSGKCFQDIYVVDLKTGERKLALRKCRKDSPFASNEGYWHPSPDGAHFLFFEDGHFHTYEITTCQKHNITKDIPTSFYREDDDHNLDKPPIWPIGWVKDGKSVLLTDNWDIWRVPVHGGEGTNLTVNGKKEGIRYSYRPIFAKRPRGKSIDLSGSIYVKAYEEMTKKCGIARIDKGKPGAKMLLWDDALFNSEFSSSLFPKSKNSKVVLYTKETYKDYPDYYIADRNLQNGRILTNANPQQKELLWSSGSVLVDYTSTKGHKLQAALFLPANYEKGKSYPTIVHIYEKLSHNLHKYWKPNLYDFVATFTSHEYAVLMPDTIYEVNDPARSAVWCVLPALEAATATGIVDKKRVGLHGHSWGGYQTCFLITQTDKFKAALAGAPLTNMISCYNSIYWGIGQTHQALFESGQGRFSSGFWTNLEAYMRNSPVLFANKVKTPLLMFHNDKDSAVDWTQGIEFFNSLRRLGKPVIMLQYRGEGHSPQKPSSRKDFFIRRKEFFDHYLMDKPAPQWIKEGVPYLKIKDHLKERSQKSK